MQRTWMAWTASLVAGCGSPTSSMPDVDGSITGDVSGDGSLVSLDKTPTTYRETCDGSGAIALSFTHFLDLNDEDQIARIYARANEAGPVHAIDLGPGLGVSGNAEADLEDIERIGERLFVVTSHGRKTSGALDRSRYRFAAFDTTGTAPDITLTSVSWSTSLLDDMLVAANWDTPDSTVISALVTSSKLGDTNEANLAPEAMGTNLEGLAHDGGGGLLIGFRNPRPNNRAIVVSLVDPAAALTGTARFGRATLLDLGGRGIRSMTYSPVHQAVLVIAGPHDGSSGPFALYRWSGAAADAPTFVAELPVVHEMSPEAIVPYPNTKDVQIVYDGGDVDIDGDPCKDAPAADRVFRDAIITVE